MTVEDMQDIIHEQKMKQSRAKKFTAEDLTEQLIQNAEYLIDLAEYAIDLAEYAKKQDISEEEILESCRYAEAVAEKRERHTY